MFFIFLVMLGASQPGIAAVPAISGQPQSVTNIAGSAVAFSGLVTGTPPLVYQWQRGSLKLFNNSRCSGTTSNALGIANVMPLDAGDYRLVVTNSEGAATSIVASLTVTVPAFLTIPDVGLEAALRSALAKPSGSLTPADLAALISLSGCGQGISNLAGLEWATNLTSLSLCNNSISNLVALEGLNKLVQLSLDGNRISNLAPLTGLTKLTSLNLGDNLIANTTPLSSLTNLTALWLQRNPVGSLASLTNLGGLKSLVLFSAGVKDLSPLSGMTNLDYLELRWNPLTNAETSLASLTNLTTLYLGGTGVSNVSFLQNLSRLSFLNLDHDNVSELSILAALPALRNLDVGYNALTNLATLAAFTNLDGLNLSGSSVSNVDSITGLTRLKGLTLHDNQITNLTPLAGLTNLNTLAVGKNPIASWVGPTAFTNLSRLWLDGNSFSNLNFIQNLRSLEAVGLNSCRQTDLTPLAGLTNMIALFADYNRLTNIDVLAGWPRLSRAQLTTNLLNLSTGTPPMAVVDTLRERNASVFVIPQNQPPRISIAPEWVVGTNNTSSLGFNAFDDITPGNQLVVTALSANTNLIPNPTVLATATADYRMLSVIPASNQTGTATITLTATDDAGLSTNVVVSVTVIAPPTAMITDTNLTQAIGWALNTSSTNFTSLDLAALTTLNLFGATLDGLNGLEWAINLQHLEFTASNLTNLSTLQSMTKLQSLSISSDTLLDCSALASMTNLTSLTLHANSVTNLAFLQNLKQLVYLSLKTRAVTSFQPVAGLTNLIGLDLSDNTPDDLILLTSLTRLTSLGLSGCRVTNIAPLATLTNLQVMQLERNRLTSINALTNLPALALVNIGYNLLNTADNPALQYLLTHGVTVDYLPQRGPPTLVTPETWFASANTASSFRTSSWDDGGSSDEYPVVTIISTTTNLVVGTNLFSLHDLPKFPKDWIISMTPPTNYAGSATLKIVATGEVGMAKTNTVTVTFALPLPVNAQLLSDTNLAWQTGGNAPWFGQSQTTYDGVSAAQSGSIGDSQESWIQTTITGPRLLSFWWKVSSEPTYDWLEFYTNNVRIHYRITGEQGWEHVVLDLSPGPQIIRWRYVKDSGYSYGEDAAWLDEVSAKVPTAISFSNLNQTYNGAGHPVSVITSPPGLPVTLTYDDDFNAPTNAGSYQVSATINDPTYYGTTTATLVIGKAPLTVIAENKMKAVGQPVPALTLQYVGFAPGDSTNTVDMPPVPVTTATNNSPPGNFPINVTGGDASNYTLNRIPGILTVTNSPLIILSLTGAGTTNAVITWTSVSSRSYELQYRSGFAAEWLPLVTNITATDWTTSAVDNSGASTQRFYRVKQLAETGTLAIYTNPPPVILFLTNPGTDNTVLTWSSTSNLNYRVLYASGLNAPWITLTPDVHATSTTATAVDQTDGVTQRYYRVMVVP